MTNAKRTTKGTTKDTAQPSQSTTPPTRIIHKATYQPISPAAKGELTYNIGCRDGVNESSKALFLRVVANSGGGFFSNEWISLDKILEVIDGQPEGRQLKFEAMHFSL